MPASTAARHHPQRNRIPLAALIIAGGLLAIALVWLALLEHIESEQAEAIHAAELANTNLVHSYKEHVRRIVSDIDLQSETLAAELRREGAARIDLAARQGKLASALPDLLQIGVIDASGRLVGSSLPMPPSPFNAAHTEHFAAHAASELPGLYIGKPLRSHFGKWSIPMTRRLTNARGAFAGVLVFSVDPEYFSHFFGQAELGKDGVVTVAREDGVVIARRAGDSWSVGADISPGPLYKTIREKISGVRLSGGRLDGHIRVIAYDTLKEYPLIVYAGTAVTEVLAPSRARRSQQYLAASFITAFIVLVTLLIVLLVRREKRAQEALRQSEMLLRATIETAPVVLFTLDAQGVFRMSTGAGLTRLGLKPGEVVGLSVSDLYRDVPDILDCVSRALKGEAVDHVQELAGIFWDTRYVPMTGEDSRVAGVVGVAVDITALKRAEAAVRALNEELEQRVERRTAELARANKELESFAYSISHDLRAPLRAMTGFSEIVLQANADRLGEQSVHHLERIQAGAKRMERLIDDLLSLSRVSRHEMHRTDFDLSRLTRKVVDNLAQAEPARSVTVKVAPDMRAYGDASLIGIALENLVGNAWKFTSRKGEAAIEIGATQVDGRTAYFVSDNGAGFDMQYSDKLFEAFQRLHHPGEFAGTGIGLSIVQRAVHRHGGRVWAEGAEGRGATFYFTLA